MSQAFLHRYDCSFDRIQSNLSALKQSYSLCTAKETLNTYKEALEEYQFQELTFTQFSKVFSQLKEFGEHLCFEDPKTFIELEKALLSWLAHPSKIVSNLAVVCLTYFWGKLTLDRKEAVAEQLTQELLAATQLCGVSKLYLRLVAVVMPQKLLVFIQENKLQFAVSLARFIGEHSELAEEVRTQLNEKSSAALHSVYCSLVGKGCSYSVSMFKAYASFVWNQHKLNQTNVSNYTALLNYSCLEAVLSSMHDQDTLKAFFATVTMNSSFVGKCSEVTHLESLLKAVESYCSTSIPSQYEHKFRFEVTKILNALISKPNSQIKGKTELLINKLKTSTENLVSGFFTNEENYTSTDSKKLASTLIKQKPTLQAIVSPVKKLQSTLKLPELQGTPSKEVLAETLRSIADHLHSFNS